MVRKSAKPPLGRVLERLRGELSQPDYARELGLTPDQYAKYEQRGRVPLPSLRAIAAHHNISADALADGLILPLVENDDQPGIDTTPDDSLSYGEEPNGYRGNQGDDSMDEFARHCLRQLKKLPSDKLLAVIDAATDHYLSRGQNGQPNPQKTLSRP